MSGIKKTKTKRSRGYFVNKELFKTKRDVENRSSQILNSYPLGTTISRKDFHFVLDLLNNHPRATEKIGVGVKAIKIVGHSEFGSNNRSFAVVRKDNSETEFSYRKCITPPKPIEGGQ